MELIIIQLNNNYFNQTKYYLGNKVFPKTYLYYILHNINIFVNKDLMRAK